LKSARKNHRSRYAGGEHIHFPEQFLCRDTKSQSMSRRMSNRRHGLTLVEVVVVLAILLLLVALMFPAVYQAREQARRTQCKNNLKQIGLALHNYHDAHRMFPPGFILGTDGVYHGWGWSVESMPYIDASPLYNTYNFGQGLPGAYTKPNLNPLINCYRCPSDGGSSHIEHAFVVTSDVSDGRVQKATVDAKDNFSRTNYFAVAGYLQAEFGGIANDASGEPTGPEPYLNAGSLGQSVSSNESHRYCDPHQFKGIFGQNSSTTIKDIKDGTSNTFMAGERYTPRNPSPGAVGHGTWLGVPDCTTTAGLAMTLGDTSIRPNAGSGFRAETSGFGSPHRGGVMFLKADGSVIFLADAIDIAVYRDSSTIDDGRDHENAQ
jgi:prepilin-type N-terminal cleavage/methylation domain-containing protein